MKRLWILAATISGALVGNSAMAAGSVENGATKAVICRACHGANGNSTNPEWPSLAGLGADDMADPGAYFASLPNTGLEADPSYWQAGEKLYRGGDPARAIPACMACHGPTARGNEPAKFPALRGQQSVYVTKQLNDYASGARTTGPNGIMETIAKRLSPEDIRNLASYLQGVR